MCVCVCVCVCIYIYIYIHTHTHEKSVRQECIHLMIYFTVCSFVPCQNQKSMHTYIHHIFFFLSLLQDFWVGVSLRFVKQAVMVLSFLHWPSMYKQHLNSEFFFLGRLPTKARDGFMYWSLAQEMESSDSISCANNQYVTWTYACTWI